MTAVSLAIIGIFLVFGLILIKMNHFRHKITIIVLLFLVLFIYSTATIVNNTYDFDFTTTEGLFYAVKVYTGWLGNGFQNLKVITANAIKMDWSSTNGSFFSKEIEPEKR